MNWSSLSLALIRRVPGLRAASLHLPGMTAGVFVNGLAMPTGEGACLRRVRRPCRVFGLYGPVGGAAIFGFPFPALFGVIPEAEPMLSGSVKPSCGFRHNRLRPSPPLRGRCLRQETEGGRHPFGKTLKFGNTRHRFTPLCPFHGHLPRKGGDGRKWQGSIRSGRWCGYCRARFCARNASRSRFRV
jgi:hypothetical protein